MKFLTAVALLVSLALNAAVAFLFFAGRNSAEPTLAVTNSAPTDRTLPAIDAAVWPDLHSDDLPTLVARLRASGFPPDIVRAILAAQIQENFAARCKALSPGTENLSFWKDQPRDPKLQISLRQLDREQQKILRDLLGNEADDAVTLASRNRSLKFLTAEKADAVREILRTYDEQRSDLYAVNASFIADRDQLAALDKEQRDAIARLLTPAELLDYDLRTSRTAINLRDELSAFNPTEEEFRAIYQLRASFNEQFNQDLLALSADDRQRRDQAQKLVTDQIKSTLSPERAAEYSLATDYNYRRTSQLVARLELPPETTGDLSKVQKEFSDRRSQIAGIPDERAQRLTALQQEALTRVTPMLGGASAVEAYKQYGGQWLQNLAPRPAPTPLVKP